MKFNSVELFLNKLLENFDPDIDDRVGLCFSNIEDPFLIYFSYAGGENSVIYFDIMEIGKGRVFEFDFDFKIIEKFLKHHTKHTEKNPHSLLQFTNLYRNSQDLDTVFNYLIEELSNCSFKPLSNLALETKLSLTLEDNTPKIKSKNKI